MLDLWGFLLQTLTVSGVAALLLLVKALFKDKLPPKWQFTVWAILGIVMLLPAGLGGRYTLFHWRLAVELLKSHFGDYSYIRVLFPFPVLTAIPRTAIEWSFAVYVMGVLAHLVKYALAYIRLRYVVRLGTPPSPEQLERLRAIASAQNMNLCRVVEVEGLPSAFMCGVLRPTLVLPGKVAVDEKILLHELFHLKHRDTLWSLVICLLRSIHWCNPLLIFCSNRALNDLESRCDQHVLEQLAGEERREYGHILLSMANEKFSKTPGSTCIHNGGKSIRTRIESIARFKKYPQGMELVAVCILLILVFPLTVGTQAATVPKFTGSVSQTLAIARVTACTTPAGAFDAYGRAVLEYSGYYRAMCAPEADQQALLDEMEENYASGISPVWDSGLDGWADVRKGFYIYNLETISDTTCQGLLVLTLSSPPDGQPETNGACYLAVQPLQVELEAGRWVTRPLEPFRYVCSATPSPEWGCRQLPGRTYAGEACGMYLEVFCQTIYSFDSCTAAPNPHGTFTAARETSAVQCIYQGSQEAKDTITRIGLSVAPVYPGQTRPENLYVPDGAFSSVSSSSGQLWISRDLAPG